MVFINVILHNATKGSKEVKSKLGSATLAFKNLLVLSMFRGVMDPHKTG